MKYRITFFDSEHNVVKEIKEPMNHSNALFDYRGNIIYENWPEESAYVHYSFYDELSGRGYNFHMKEKWSEWVTFYRIKQRLSGYRIDNG